MKARSEISPREMDVKSFGSGARGFASEFGNGCDNYEGYSQNANDGGADGKIDFGGDKQTDDAADRCDHPADGEFRPDPIHLPPERTSLLLDIGPVAKRWPYRGPAAMLPRCRLPESRR